MTGVRIAIDATELAIAGTLVDGRGVAIADARIRVSGDGHDGERISAATSTLATDADGHFRIAQLAPGAYTISARAPDGRSVERRGVVAGTSDLALVFDAQCHGNAPTTTGSRPPARIAWDERVELVGWDAPAHVVRGAPFEVALTYRVLRPLDRPWTIFIHFDGETTKARRIADHDPSCPTTAWRAGDYVVERFTTTIDLVPPGTYDMSIGFFTGAAPHWQNLPVSDAPTASRDGWEGIKTATIAVE